MSEPTLGELFQISRACKALCMKDPVPTRLRIMDKSTAIAVLHLFKRKYPSLEQWKNETVKKWLEE